MESICEHGVNVVLKDKVLDVLGRKNVLKKATLSTSRAIALCSLSILKKETSWKVTALDCIRDVGLAGIQWVKHLGNNACITINIAGDVDDIRSALVKNNCLEDANSLKIISEDPLAHMHKNKYAFIYLEVCGHAVTYFDAALRSIKHDGMLFVTTTDVTVLQNLSPAASRRLYDAKLWKSEYYKELGVRALIANIVRSASRWGKGIEVLLCVAEESGVSVLCRVHRGSHFGEKCISKLNYIAHCQLCQARSFLPDSQFVLDNDTLPVLCHCSFNGIKAPVLNLGPVWSGIIFNKKFLFSLVEEMKELNVDWKYRRLVESLILESVCCVSEEQEKELLSYFKENEDNESIEPEAKKRKIKPKPLSCGATDKLKNCNDAISSLNIYIESSQDSDKETITSKAFYFDVQNHSVKGGNPPTVLSVITKLRSDGYAASKSHFGRRCIRTSASLSVFKEVLEHLWNITKNKSVN